MKKKPERREQLRLRKRTILVLNDDQAGEAAGAGSNISCDGGDCFGGATGNLTECWETCNTCHQSCPHGTCNGHTCADTCGCPTQTCCNC